AGILGRAFARHHRLRFAPAALRVTRLGSSKKLGRQARRARVRGLYRIRRPRQVKGCHVVLVDDVMTTGATVQEVSRQLRLAGASSVEVVTLARYAV
ncbi:MAG: putative amidophosphoribosyltransferase, partial [Myxococcota bacterium]